VQVASSPDAALRDPAVDAVVVCTPTIAPFLAKAALEAGKHVLVEKPITTRSDQGEELCRLAESRGLVLLVGHIFLYNAAVRFVKRSLDSGELGRVYYISMVRTNLGPIRMDVNAAWDLAAHDIAIVDYWLGGSARSVSASGAPGSTWHRGFGVRDAALRGRRAREPARVVAESKKAREITVVGERRMVTVDDMNLGNQSGSTTSRSRMTAYGPGSWIPSLRSRQRARWRHHDTARELGGAAQGRMRSFHRVHHGPQAADHGRGVGGARGEDARSDHALHAQPGSRGAGLTTDRIPLVDLAAQHRQIAEEVSAGFARVLERTSFILGGEVAEFEASFAGRRVPHCIGVAGTDGSSSLRALGIGAGDEVVVRPTRSSRARSPSRARALPVLVDYAAPSCSTWRTSAPG
jgi:predicted dehydrogenase